MDRNLTHNRHYVYVYTDPRKAGHYEYNGFVFNYEPFYVGSGKGYRWKRHLTNFEIDWNYNTIKNGKIKHLKEKFDLEKYIIFYKTDLTKEESLIIEKGLIVHFGRLNTNTGFLSNMTDGGEGWFGAVSPFKGKTYEEIHGIEKANSLKKNKSNQLKGNNYGTYTKGKKMSDEGKKHLSDIKKMKVKQLNLEMNLIQTWDSPKHAADSLGIYVGSIHNVLGNQKSKTAGGFRWEYVNKKNKKYG